MASGNSARGSLEKLPASSYTVWALWFGELGFAYRGFVGNRGISYKGYIEIIFPYVKPSALYVYIYIYIVLLFATKAL